MVEIHVSILAATQNPPSELKGSTVMTCGRAKCCLRTKSCKVFPWLTLKRLSFVLRRILHALNASSRCCTGSPLALSSLLGFSSTTTSNDASTTKNSSLLFHPFRLVLSLSPLLLFAILAFHANFLWQKQCVGDCINVVKPAADDQDQEQWRRKSFVVRRRSSFVVRRRSGLPPFFLPSKFDIRWHRRQRGAGPAE